MGDDQRSSVGEVPAHAIGGRPWCGHVDRRDVLDTALLIQRSQAQAGVLAAGWTDGQDAPVWPPHWGKSWRRIERPPRREGGLRQEQASRVLTERRIRTSRWSLTDECAIQHPSVRRPGDWSHGRASQSVVAEVAEVAEVAGHR